MPNTFITPTVIARTALATLYNTTVAAQLVWRDFDEAFTGKQGDTVTIRKPAVFEAEEFNRASGITLQDITEDSVTLQLDTIPNVSFPVTDEEMTLEISDFQNQLLVPAMEAIAQKIDGDIAEQLIDASEANTPDQVVTISPGSDNARELYTGEDGARAILGRRKAPLTQRYAIFSPELAGIALDDEWFTRVDASGATQALREGQIGKTFGFDNYESQVLGVGSGDKGQADGVAFHRQAVALAMRPLQQPRGIASSQSSQESYKGLSLRVVYAYNNLKKQDEVSVDTLYGLATMRQEFAITLSAGLGS